MEKGGFTILEMVGVLAILSILVSMLAPSMILRINRANSAKESKALTTLGEALERQILKNRAIPDGSNWFAFVADELGTPVPYVTRSVGQQPRIYLVEPGISVGGQSGILPYAQSSAGSPQEPVNLRVMIISSQLQPLPGFLASGVAPDGDSFENLWNGPRGKVPEGWPPEWAGHGEDLHVERLNLAPLFHRLVINDITEESSAEISIDGAAAIPIPPGGWSAYYFKGTEVTLLNSGAVDGRELIDRDLSYTYERGIWRGQLWEGKAKAATALAAALDRFRLARITAPASAVSSQRLVIDAYHNFALLYASWARAGFPAYVKNGKKWVTTPLYQALLDAQAQLESLSENMLLR